MAVAAEDQISQEVLISRAERLLVEWGECQRGAAGAQVGSMGASPIATMMRNWGRRTRPSRRQQALWRRTRRLVPVNEADPSSRRVAVLPMYPERNDKQTRSPAARDEPWPAHIVRLDQVLARMPRPLVRVATSYYVYMDSIRQGAVELNISKAEYDTRLERVRWFVIGNLAEVDAALSGQ